MWTIFKVFIEFIKVLFQFYVLVVWLQGHVGSEFPWPGIKPVPATLKVEVLATGLPGSPWMFNLRLTHLFKMVIFIQSTLTWAFKKDLQKSDFNNFIKNI